MHHRAFFTDRYRPPALGRVRPDLRMQAVIDWETIPVEPGYVWREVGPMRGIRNPGLPEIDSGLISTIALGSDPTHLTVGTRFGGVWSSNDEGVTWTAHGDRLPSLQTIAVSRFDQSGQPPLLMAGCGMIVEEELRDPGLAGVFRSIDGGRTWASIDAGAFGTRFRSHDVNRVIALDRDRLLVATRVGLYFSKDGGRNFGNDADHRNGEPMLRGHVTDLLVDGTTVAAAVAGEPTDARDPRPPELAAQLATAPVDPGLYLSQLTATSLAAFGTAARRTQAALADVPSKTVLGHSGRFWLMSASKLDTLRRSETAPRPSNTLHSVHLTRRDPVTAAGWGTLSASERNALNASATSYCHVAAIEPSTSATEFHAWWGAVGLFRARADVSSGSWRWTSSERGTNTDEVHVDHHALRVDDLTGPTRRRILVGNDGGLFLTTTAGASWVARNDHGTALLWSLSLARGSGSNLRLLCGVQDNGTIIGEGDPNAAAPWTTWHKIRSGDGGLNAFIARNRTSLPTADPVRAVFGGNGSPIEAERSGGPGSDWVERTLAGSSTVSRAFIFSETVAVGRSSSGEWDRMFFGNSEARNGPGILWRRMDGTANFAEVHPGAPYTVGLNGEWSAMITALAFVPADPATERSGSPGAWTHLWVGLANGELWFSNDAGNSFQRMNAGGGDFPITAIAVDPNDSRRVAVVYGGFTEGPTNGPTGHVFLSEDLGARWRDISGRRGADGFVPDLPVLSAFFTRTDPPALILGTDMGVLMTRGPTLGTRWTRLGANLPRLPCTQVAVINDLGSSTPPALSAGLPPIAAATFGRGAWVLARPSAAEAVIELDGGFGAMRVGETRQRTITIHNVGGAALGVGSPSVSAPFSLTGVPSGSIPARESRSFTIVCNPTSAGSFAAQLAVAGATVAISCEAFADGPPRLAFWPRQINFGDVPDGQTVEQPVEVQNFGQSELRITAVTASGSPSARFEFDPTFSTAVVLAAGERRAIRLRFRATGANTHHDGTWRFQSNDPIVDTSHFEIRARAHVTAATSDGGIPAWVWIVGGVVAAGVVGLVAWGIYKATKKEEEPTPPGP